MNPQVWVCGPLGLDFMIPQTVDPRFGVEDSQVWFYAPPPRFGVGFVEGTASSQQFFVLQVCVCSSVAELVLHSRCHQEKPRWVCCAHGIPCFESYKNPNRALGCFVVKPEGQSQPQEIPREPLVLFQSPHLLVCRDFVPSSLGN